MTKEQTEILVKVQEMYNKYGIKSITMDDVAHELNISKKTLYLHFSDKEQLVEQVVKATIDEKNAIIDAIIAESEDAISEMMAIHQFMDKITREHSYVMENDLRKYYPSLFNHIISVKRERMYSIALANILKGQASGLYRSDVNAQIIAKVNQQRFESLVNNCIFSTDELQSADFYRQVLEYHIRGIATKAGMNRIEELFKTENIE